MARSIFMSGVNYSAQATLQRSEKWLDLIPMTCGRSFCSLMIEARQV